MIQELDGFTGIKLVKLSVEYIEIIIENLDERLSKVHPCTADRIRFIIRQLIAAAKTPSIKKHNAWVPVGKLPPKANENYGVSMPVLVRDECKSIAIGYYNYKTKCWYFDKGFFRPTHWTHLPEMD